MRMQFDEIKATQTAAFLLNLAGGSLNYMSLIKLLYKADRDALQQLGMPITTDTYSSLKHGPITSGIYDRIKASANPNSHPSFWSSHIKPAGQWIVELVNDPGVSELSPAEEQILREVFVRDGHKDAFMLADECHRDFPEWQNPGSSSTPIEICDILSALCVSEDEAAHAKASVDLQRAAMKLSV